MSLQQQIDDINSVLNDRVEPNDLTANQSMPTGGKVVVVNPANNSFETVPKTENLPKPAIPRTTSFTISASMHDEYVECTNNADITATIPTNATTPITIGTYITIAQSGDGFVVIEGATGVTLLFEDGYVASTRAKNTVLMLRKTATDTWLIFGALKTA